LLAAPGVAVVSLGVAGFAWFQPRGTQDDAFPYRLEIAANADARFGATVLSPDGRAIVSVRGVPASPNLLYFRRLDQPTARPTPGTEGASDPVFSPDGRSIGPTTVVVPNWRTELPRLAGASNVRRSQRRPFPENARFSRILL
jgi:hypothetical protein